jgi:hypothetical protein
MSEPSRQYALLLGLSFFLHLLVVPDYLVYQNTCLSGSAGASGVPVHTVPWHTGPGGLQALPPQSYTWLFAFCMTLVAVELLALLFWIGVYRTPYAAQFSALAFSAPRSARYAAIVTWVMHGVTLVTSLVLLSASATTTLVQVVLTVLIRLFGIALTVLATVLDLHIQQKVQEQGEEVIYSQASGTDDTVRL